MFHNDVCLCVLQVMVKWLKRTVILKWTLMKINRQQLPQQRNKKCITVRMIKTDAIYNLIFFFLVWREKKKQETKKNIIKRVTNKFI